MSSRLDLRWLALAACAALLGGTGTAGADDELGEPLALDRVGRRKPESLGREREPREMPVEQEGPAAVDVRRLEDGAAAKERIVVRGEHRLVRLDEPASGHRNRADVHHASASNGRAFTHDSSISASASESQTIPPPTQRWISPSTTANVRIVSARSRSPFA